MILKENKLQWSPGFDAAGIYNIEISAEDTESNSLQAFKLTVDNTNRQPVITSKPVKVGHEDVAYVYPLSADDADQQQLSFSLVQAPRGMLLSKDKLIWKPDFSQSGTHEVRLTVSDGEARVEQFYTLDISETNREPSFDEISDQTIVAGRKLSLSLVARDVDQQPLSYQIIYAPKMAKINKSNGLIQWQTQKADIGDHTIIVSVSDGDLKVRRYFDVKVINN